MNPSIGGSLRDLAEDLDLRWRRLEREPGRFPELAHECLERAALAGLVGVDGVMAWVRLAHPVESQRFSLHELHERPSTRRLAEIRSSKLSKRQEAEKTS